jgi:S-(hydroxymethyl)glutathione dehydrogenase/alcohol dehydrogenase
MMMKTEAAVLEKIGAPLVIEELELPELTMGQVAVRIYASGICGAQLNEISGAKGPDEHLPHLLGHEGGGIVLEIGPGVTRIHRGEHVVVHWRRSPGIESAFPLYRSVNGRFVGGGLNATFQEISVVSENRLTPVPDDVPHDIAALMGCAVTTGLGVVFNDAQLRPGQSIAVIGCGGVGLNVIQGARLAGALTIAAVDVSGEKLYMAQEFGANGLIDIKDDPASLEFLRGLDVIVDTTGRPELIARAYELVAAGGKVIMVGQPRRGEGLTIPDIGANFRGKTLMDSTGGGTMPDTDIPKYLGLWRRGKLKLGNLITHLFPLAEVNEALEIARSGTAGRVILWMP